MGAPTSTADDGVHILRRGSPGRRWPAGGSASCGGQGTLVVRLPEVPGVVPGAPVEAPPTTTERRLETITDAAMTRTAPRAISRRIVVFASSPNDMATIA